MALIKCHECRNDVSTEAKSCPKCGAKVRRPTSPLTYIFLVLFGLSLFYIFGATRPDVPPAPPTPEQLAESAKKETRFQKTRIVAQAIKSSLRDPASLQWDSIGVTDDASVMCFVYRAKNGFNAMTQEFVVHANGKTSQTPAAWNKYCANKTSIDLLSVRFALD